MGRRDGCQRDFKDQVGSTALGAYQCSLICQVGCERRCQYRTHGYRMPQHPIFVHSRVITPVINYKPRLGSHFLKKWISGLRTSIWVGLIHPSGFPGLLPHRLRSPRTNLAALPSFSTPCPSLLGWTSRWTSFPACIQESEEVETWPSEGDRPGLKSKFHLPEHQLHHL